MIIGKKHIKRLNLKETDLYFVLAGICAVFTDYLVYIYIINFINISLAKGIAFFCGVVVSWIINSNLTFNTNDKKLIQFFKYIFVLFFTMSLNIVVNNFFLYLLVIKYEVSLSFLVATSISTAANFILFKYWVFKK